MSKDPFADIVNAPDDQFGAFADTLQPQDHRTMPPGRAQDYQNTQPQLMTNAKVSGQKLPVVWNATVDGVPVQAALDTQAGAYLFNDASGKPNMLIRKPDGSLGARPYQYPGTNPIEGMTTGQIMAAGLAKARRILGAVLVNCLVLAKATKQAAEELAIRERDAADGYRSRQGWLCWRRTGHTMVTPGVLLKVQAQACRLLIWRVRLRLWMLLAMQSRFRKHLKALLHWALHRALCSPPLTHKSASSIQH